MIARTMRALVPSLLSIAIAAGSLAAQQPAGSGGVVTLVALDGRERPVSMQELTRLARVDTTVSAHRVTGRYSGVPLPALLALVGAPTGDSLRGRALATTLLVRASDGYQVAFSLGEVDAALSGRLAMLAYAKDGAPLAADEGPYRLIVPGDTRPARWARQVVRIELQRPR